LEPGAYLDETDLAQIYGISRPPLREVLRQLAGEGYVVLHENRSAQVVPMTHKTLRNFFVAAPMIHAATTRLAAEHATAPQIVRLKECQWTFRQAIKSGDAAERALGNERFHSLVGEMAENEYLMPLLRRLLIDHTRIGMTFYNPRKLHLAPQRELAADQHDQLIALIEAGDAAADLPIMLYNYPGRMGINMGEAFLDRVGRSANIAAIKQSSGDINRVHLLARDYPHVQMSCGMDDQALEFFAWGARWWVCGGSNFRPAEHLALYKAHAVDGNFDKGRRIMSALMPLMRVLEQGGKFIQCIKHGCEMMGQYAGPPSSAL
jgi:DNA-binding GntR family transcriptional regulator